MERKIYITKTGEEFSYLASDIKKGSRNFVFFHATGFNAETYKILFNKIKIHFDKWMTANCSFEFRSFKSFQFSKIFNTAITRNRVN